MKYMIMLYGSQQDYDVLVGKPTDKPAMSPEDIAAMHAYMEKFNNELEESGELVDARGLSAPVHARRVQLKAGAPVVTDGPYPETQEVLAGYNDRRVRELRPGHRAGLAADQPGRRGRVCRRASGARRPRGPVAGRVR